MKHHNKTVATTFIIVTIIAAIVIIAGCLKTNQPTNTPDNTMLLPSGVLVITPDSAGSTDNTATPLVEINPTITPTPSPSPTPTVDPLTTLVTMPPDVSPVPGSETSNNPAYAGKKIIALTYDDGPNNLLTPPLLDVLKERNVKATFFVLGENVSWDDNKPVLKRAADEGHEIGNHSYDHPKFNNMTAEQIQKQLSDTNNLIKEVTGRDTILLRTPYGIYGKTILQQCGMAIVLWDVDTNDWNYIHVNKVRAYAEENGITEEAAADILVDRFLFEGFYTTQSGKSVWVKPLIEMIKHGSIILFHDRHQYSTLATAKLIDYLRSQGDEYVFMTVSDMIQTEGAAPKAGDVYRTMWEAYMTNKNSW